MNEFFSVCISSVNRGETIYKTLESLSNQVFRNFEVIIVDCQSTDQTLEEINRYFNSDHYKTNPFPYQLHKKEYTPKTVEDWNEPLQYATGKFIAMLEGDDQFYENHLQEAYKILSADPEVAIYFNGGKKHTGKMKSADILKYFYSLDGVPAPSEAIFRRLDSKGNPNLYNITDFIYAPEVDLYLRICLDGNAVYYSSFKNVYRHKFPKSRGKWKYYRDHYYILDKYYTTLCNDRKLYNQYVKIIDDRAFQGYIYDKLVFGGKYEYELRTNLVKKYGYGKFIAGVTGNVITILVRLIKRRLTGSK